MCLHIALSDRTGPGEASAGFKQPYGQFSCPRVHRLGTKRNQLSSEEMELAGGWANHGNTWRLKMPFLLSENCQNWKSWRSLLQMSKELKTCVFCQVGAIPRICTFLTLMFSLGQDKNSGVSFEHTSCTFDCVSSRKNLLQRNDLFNCRKKICPQLGSQTSRQSLLCSRLSLYSDQRGNFHWPWLVPALRCPWLFLKTIQIQSSHRKIKLIVNQEKWSQAAKEFVSQWAQ